MARIRRVAEVAGSAEFVVTFEGPAVEAGRMPVRDLAPALLSLADIVQEANAVTADGAARVSLDIRAFDKGSFDVALALWATASVLASDPVTAAANLITLTTTSLDLFRRFRGRRVAERSPVTPDQTRIVLDDHTEIIAPSNAVTLVERETFAPNARGLFRPLRQPGVELLRIKVDGRSQLDVPAEDVAQLEDQADAVTPALVNEAEARVPLAVAAPSFIEDNKWRLTDDREHTDWYDMRDERFSKRVADGEESFRKGDSLLCRVNYQRWRAPNGTVSVERQIVEVLEHRSPPEAPLLLP